MTEWRNRQAFTTDYFVEFDYTIAAESVERDDGHCVNTSVSGVLYKLIITLASCYPDGSP